jgi:hypothetical protein
MILHRQPHPPAFQHPSENRMPPMRPHSAMSKHLDVRRIAQYEPLFAEGVHGNGERGDEGKEEDFEEFLCEKERVRRLF